MKMVGGGDMVVYPTEDERPHVKQDDADWQESFLLCWWDAASSVGGYFRLGHEPNRTGDGQAQVWAVVHAPGESYYRCSTYPITAADRFAGGIGGGNGVLTYRYDDRCRWTVFDENIAVSLDLEDFHPAVDGYIKDGQPHVGSSQRHHVEVACRVTGTATIKGKSFAIDGLAMRDHAWGERHWNDNRAHRWCVGVFDRDNSFCAVTMHLSSHVIPAFGWVIRGNNAIYADATEIVAHMAPDGFTNVGGTVRMKLSTGEHFEAHFDPLAPCALFQHPLGLRNCPTLTSVSWGSSKGIGVFETSMNLAEVNTPSKVFSGGLAVNGWHPQRA